jgi:hypothetical protein
VIIRETGDKGAELRRSGKERRGEWADARGECADMHARSAAIESIGSGYRGKRVWCYSQAVSSCVWMCRDGIFTMDTRRSTKLPLLCIPGHSLATRSTVHECMCWFGFSNVSGTPFRLPAMAAAHHSAKVHTIVEAMRIAAECQVRLLCARR